MILYKKRKVFLGVAVLLMLTFSNLFIVNADSFSKISGDITQGKIEINLTENDDADKIIIDMFPNDSYDFLKRFNNAQNIVPGGSYTGEFIINNNTGRKYTITDYEFSAIPHATNRVSGAVAKAYGLNATQVFALSAEEWYQKNLEWYNREMDKDGAVALNILAKMFQGASHSYPNNESSVELTAMAHNFLHQVVQLSFDPVNYPITANRLSEKALSLSDYIEKNSLNKDIFLNDIFKDKIDQNGFSTPIKLTMDMDKIGNSFNGRSMDFRFTLTLTADPLSSTTENTASTPTSAMKSDTVTPDTTAVIPKTGDNAIAFIVLLMVALTAGIVLIVRFKKTSLKE